MYDGKGMGDGMSSFVKIAIVSSASLFVACCFIIFGTNFGIGVKIIAGIPIVILVVAVASALDWKYIGNALQFWKKSK